MILYTPLCNEDIFPSSDQNIKRKIVNYGGRNVEVMKTSEGSYQLLQIISTNPQDFLDSDLAPGNIIKNIKQ